MKKILKNMYVTPLSEEIRMDVVVLQETSPGGGGNEGGGGDDGGDET